MISNIPLALMFAVATYLIRLCHKSPHVPESRYANDNLFAVPIVKEHGAVILEYLLVIPGIHHVIVTAFFKDLVPSGICPHPDHISAKYFTWSSYTILTLTIIFVSATLRLMAYQKLGKNFTFQLAKPDQLVTSGIYAHVQHPSYGPLFVVTCATLMLFLQFDGAPGCFLPLWAVELWITWRWHILATAMAIIGFGIGVRVRDEEAMLKETFGDTWMDWHRKTPRFVPFLF